MDSCLSGIKDSLFVGAWGTLAPKSLLLPCVMEFYHRNLIAFSGDSWLQGTIGLTWLLRHSINFSDLDIEFLTPFPEGEVEIRKKTASRSGGAHAF